METDRGRAEHFEQHGREQVLAGVLLHMIETADQIDPAVDFVGSEGRAQNVRDAVPFVDYFDDVDSAQAGRYRKAGRRRWDRTPFDPDKCVPAGIRTRVDCASPEFGEVAVVIIEALSH